MLGFYNYKVTGEPLRLPYQLYGAQYEAVGNFVFQRTPDQSLTYHHAELKALMYDRYVKDARSYNLPDALSQKLMTLWTFFCTDWPLSLPLLALPFAWSNQRFRWALMFLLLFLLGMGVEVKVLPHYYAPGACLLLVAMMGGLHRLRYWNPQGKPTGSLLARIVVAATIAIFIKELIHKPVQYSTGGDDYKELRRGLIAELNAQPGKHLILVRYGPNHNPDMDFVVNGADVNSSRILWARSMNPQADRELVEYFHDRRMWFLDGDREAPQLEPLLIDLTARR